MLLFLPELFLLGGGLIFFFLSLGTPKPITLRLVSLSLSLAVILGTIPSFFIQGGDLFFASYRIDLFSQLFKLFMALSTIAVISFSGSLTGIREKYQAEYYLFLFMSLLGLMMLVSSIELLAIFIALELASFTVYIMVPMRGGKSLLQTEAGIKYLLFGVMATGFMLFGMSYIFGLCGTTYLDEIIPQVSTLYTQPAGIIAVMLVMAAFFYKLGILPFHFWVPDVYEGSSNETTAFIATIPKLAGAAVLFRLVMLISAEGEIITNVLLILSLTSMFYGNLSALVQKDLKRMLGFSGISHAGFVLFGIFTLQLEGYTTAFYYITGYVVMTLGCFLVICAASQKGKNLSIDDLKGLNTRNPLLAVTLLISLFSLAGIPPFVGFTGKFMLLIGALKEGHLLAVILAAFNTAIGIYYYLNVVRVSFCNDTESINTKIQTSFQNKVLSIIVISAIIVLGLFPTLITELGAKAILPLM